MAIESCDHGDYIVVYDMGIGKKTACPVCDMVDELNDALRTIKDLNDVQQEMEEAEERSANQ